MVGIVLCFACLLQLSSVIFPLSAITSAFGQKYLLDSWGLEGAEEEKKMEDSSEVSYRVSGLLASSVLLFQH